MVTASPDLHDLEQLLAGARWFSGKGRSFTLANSRRIGELGADGGPGLIVELVTVAYDDGTEEQYQVPLSLHDEPQPHLEHALVGTWGSTSAYDAVHDRAAMDVLRDCFHLGGQHGGLTFRTLPDANLGHSPGTALVVEQSNSSVAYGQDAMLKLFRRITPGTNPDVEIHQALTRDGCQHITPLYAWLEAPGTDAGGTDPAGTDPAGEVLQLALVQQFLRTASDGWELARASVRNLYAEGDLHAHEVGGDFAAESFRLGGALAETHAALARSFGTWPTDLGALAERLSERLDAAAALVPELATYAERLRPTLAGVTGLGEVASQRVHGDLHLGQTLRTVKGWKLVDFEGEPARPLAERALPDPVWRDVAGMMRSFDYAAAVVARELDSSDPAVVDQRGYRATEWSARNREAFLDGYTDGHGLTPAEQALLDAFEVDKAAYECVYEARHRPPWVGIPLMAVRRLSGESVPRSGSVGAE